MAKNLKETCHNRKRALSKGVGRSKKTSLMVTLLDLLGTMWVARLRDADFETSSSQLLPMLMVGFLLNSFL